MDFHQICCQQSTITAINMLNIHSYRESTTQTSYKIQMLCILTKTANHNSYKNADLIKIYSFHLKHFSTQWTVNYTQGKIVPDTTVTGLPYM